MRRSGTSSADLLLVGLFLVATVASLPFGLLAFAVGLSFK